MTSAATPYCVECGASLRKDYGDHICMRCYTGTTALERVRALLAKMQARLSQDSEAEQPKETDSCGELI